MKDTPVPEDIRRVILMVDITAVDLIDPMIAEVTQEDIR